MRIKRGRGFIALPPPIPAVLSFNLARLVRALGTIGLWLGVSSRTVAFASDDLDVQCPELERERVAEIESRARASLLLTAIDARLRIRCQGAVAVIEASAGAGRAIVRAPISPATVVDDVLAGLDQALEQLRARPPQLGPEPTPVPSSAAPVVPVPAAPLRVPAVHDPGPQPVGLSVPGGAPTQTRSFTVVSVAAGLEAWSSLAAGGVVIAARRGRAPFWLGLSGSVFRPLSQDQRFDVTELSLSATLTLQPAFARGLCLTLQAGPSWLWTVPEPALAVQSHRLGAAFVGGAELSWPVWRGRTGVIPGFGVRAFAMERGVRLDHVERFALGGLAPHIALALVHRID